MILAMAPAITYTEGVAGQPVSFLPSHSLSQNDRTVSGLIYRSVFKYDIYGSLVPDLADQWSISEDGLVYTVTLKDNQFWTDGKQITSDDLIYTAYKTPDLSGVATDRVDNLTVRFTLPNKFAPFLSLLTNGVMQTGSEEKYDPLFPVSSGQFRVVSVERSGPIVKQITLINAKDNIKKLVFRYYANEEELSLAAKLGEIDGFLANNPVEVENFVEYKFPVQGVYYALFFNLSKESLKDLDLRKKLEKVLPIEDVIFNTGIPVQGAISRSLYTSKTLNFDHFDEDFSDETAESTVTLTMTIPDLKSYQNLAKQVRDYWEDKLNIKVLIKSENSDTFNQEVIQSRNYEVLLYGQEIARDPDRYVNWHSTQKDHPGLNLSAFEHVRADRALEEGRKEIDNDKRYIHYNEFQKVIDDQVPAIFLCHPFAKYYINKRVTGFGDKYTFSITDRFLDFDNWNIIRLN